MVKMIKADFSELIAKISQKHGGKPLIVFFDDLDRCLPDDAIQLLEALKNLFVTPDCNCIFICGIDTRVAKRFIDKHYHGIGENFSIDYFRKIFNLTISMPYSPDIWRLLSKQIRELYGWEDVKAKELANVIDTWGLQAQIYSIRKYLDIVTDFYVFLKFNPRI